MNWDLWVATAVNAVLLFIIGMIAKPFLESTIKGQTKLNDKFDDLKSTVDSLKRSIDITLENEIRLMNQRFTNFDKNLWERLKEMNTNIFDNTIITKRRTSEVHEIKRKYEQRDDDYRKVLKQHKTSIEYLGDEIMLIKGEKKNAKS